MAKFDDSDDEEDRTPKVTSLTEFSAETIAAEVVRAPLVVPRIENTFRNGGKVYRPNALHRESKNRFSIEELEAQERSRNSVYGLSKAAKGELRLQQDTSSDVLPLSLEASECKQAVIAKRPDKNETELAISEILNPSVKEDGLIIQSSRSNVLFDSKSTRFADEHPDMSTLEDYENVPVEEFGLAMLRGMGFVPPSVDKKAVSKQADRRPDFLGLGASERPDETKSRLDLEKKRFQKRLEDRIYVPVVRRNKRTGEIVTNDSLSTNPISNSTAAQTKANGDQSTQVRPLHNPKSHRERINDRQANFPHDHDRARQQLPDHQYVPIHRKLDHEQSRYRHETKADRPDQRSRKQHTIESSREFRDMDRLSYRDRSRERSRHRDRYHDDDSARARGNERKRQRDRRRSRSR